MGYNDGNNFLFGKSGWMDLLNILLEIYVSSFNWYGLPETCDETFMELTLLNDSKCGFIYDDVLGSYFTLPLNSRGSNRNVYTKQVEYYAKGWNYNFPCTEGINLIQIYNTSLQYPVIPRLIYLSKRIFNIEKTIDININNMKTPWIIRTDKNGEYSMRQIFRKIDNGEPAVFVDKMVSDDSFKLLEVKLQFLADSLDDVRKRLLNEALSLVGIVNNYSEKNERLTADEALISNGFSNANKENRLKQRKKACQKINKLFGLKLDVEFSNLNLIDLVENNLLESGDGTNGTIYDGTNELS